MNVSLKEALDMFYKSETCRRFHDEETGLYLQGNLYVLNDFLAEMSAFWVAGLRFSLAFLWWKFLWSNIIMCEIDGGLDSNRTVKYLLIVRPEVWKSLKKRIDLSQNLGFGVHARVHGP